MAGDKPKRTRKRASKPQETPEAVAPPEVRHRLTDAEKAARRAKRKAALRALPGKLGELVRVAADIRLDRDADALEKLEAGLTALLAAVKVLRDE